MENFVESRKQNSIFWITMTSLIMSFFLDRINEQTKNRKNVYELNVQNLYS